MRKLTGKTALVTGASSGLGWRFAQVLSENGAAVALAARRTDQLELLANEIAERGGKAAVFTFDALDRDAPDALIAAVKQELGVPDILINNAGINRSARAQEASLDDFEATMAVNLRAPWRLSQLCAQCWIADGVTGSIVNLSSVLSQRVEKGLSLYCASKAAIRHMTACHALEWARYGIRVNALCPGYVKTGINEQYWETAPGKAQIAKLPAKRVGVPSDLDGALLLLADPANRFVNGEALIVDDAQGWAI